MQRRFWLHVRYSSQNASSHNFWFVFWNRVTNAAHLHSWWDFSAKLPNNSFIIMVWWFFFSLFRPHLCSQYKFCVYESTERWHILRWFSINYFTVNNEQASRVINISCLDRDCLLLQIDWSTFRNIITKYQRNRQQHRLIEFPMDNKLGMEKKIKTKTILLWGLKPIQNSKKLHFPDILYSFCLDVTVTWIVGVKFKFYEFCMIHSVVSRNKYALQCCLKRQLSITKPNWKFI